LVAVIVVVIPALPPSSMRTVSACASGVIRLGLRRRQRLILRLGFVERVESL
jgi:hypothetical protein